MELSNRFVLIWIRGAGDIATGVGVRLLNAGFKVIYSEVKEPTVIRRTVAFGSAVYEGISTIEGYSSVNCTTVDEVEKALENNQIPIFTGNERQGISKFKPVAFVEGTIRKKCTEVPRDLVPFTVALGPEFSVPKDVDAVIETMRGHYLGQVIWKGMAIPNTSVPGDIGGFTHERVIHAPMEGKILDLKNVGDMVVAGEPIAVINNLKKDESIEVLATISGILRGLIYNDLWVEKGMKIADIDPRCKREHCFSVSDKARSVGGGVLEAIMHFMQSNTKGD